MGKICYSYNPNNDYIFTSEYEAQESPRQKGVYLLPANATWKEPLPSKDNYLVCFNKEKDDWEYKLDLSIIKYYDIRTGYYVDNPNREDYKYYTEKKPSYYPNLVYWSGSSWLLKLDLLKENILRDMSYFEDYVAKDGFLIEGYGAIDLNEDTYYRVAEMVENAYNKFYKSVTFRMKDNSMVDIKTDDLFFAKLAMYNILQENKMLIFNFKDSVKAAKNTNELLEITIKDLRLLDYIEKYKNKEVTDE